MWIFHNKTSISQSSESTGGTFYIDAPTLCGRVVALSYVRTGGNPLPSTTLLSFRTDHPQQASLDILSCQASTASWTKYPMVACHSSAGATLNSTIFRQSVPLANGRVAVALSCTRTTGLAGEFHALVE